jgi:hypothetical protein
MAYRLQDGIPRALPAKTGEASSFASFCADGPLSLLPQHTLWVSTFPMQTRSRAIGIFMLKDIGKVLCTESLMAYTGECRMHRTSTWRMTKGKIVEFSPIIHFQEGTREGQREQAPAFCTGWVQYKRMGPDPCTEP